MNRLETFLSHYGVKGQQWGVRKKRSSGSSSRGKKPGTRTYDPKKLNNDELKRITSRMRLEQDYAKLNNSAQSTNGKKYVNELLQGSGKSVVGAIAGGAGALLFQQYIAPRLRG